MPFYINDKPVALIIGEEFTTVTEENINTYKFEDLSEIIQKGGTLATNSEYVSSEIKLQKLYNDIMIGGNDNG